ncbi:MAG: hypothetical protein AAFN07_15380 [Pseudomonadota bacterium]
MSEANSLEDLESLLGISLRAYYPVESIDHPAILLGRVTDSLASAVSDGIPRAVEDACLLLSHDPKLPFGKGTKARLARALKKQSGKLNEVDRSRVVECTAKLLSLEFCPTETDEYCRLIRHISPEAVNAVVASATPISDKGRHLLKVMQTTVG